jgi:hypothetical protein
MIPALVFPGIFAMGLMAALALFLSLKREVRREVRKHRARMDALAKRMDEEARRPASVPVETPAEEPLSQAAAGPLFQAAAEPLSQMVPLRSGLNLSKRVQAVRLLRRGEDVSHVAAALGVTRREVELLIRVQKLSSQRAASAGGSAAR